jgi:hypothetical protein
MNEAIATLSNLETGGNLTPFALRPHGINPVIPADNIRHENPIWYLPGSRRSDTICA